MARLAREQIEPKVREMEQKGDVLPEIRQLMFDNGVSLKNKQDKIVSLNFEISLWALKYRKSMVDLD